MNHGLATRIEQLNESEDYDKVRSGILTALSAIPVIGSPMATLLADYLPDWKIERVKRFLKDLASDVERSKTELDEHKAKHLKGFGRRFADFVVTSAVKLE